MLALLCAVRSGAAQDAACAEGGRAIETAFNAQRWQAVIDCAQDLRNRDADAEYHFGVALGQLGRWDEARAALLRGRSLRPREARFPVELGGVAFKQKHFAAAADWLRLALQMSPGDAYAADFLGTIYFLQGNLDAALKYWNWIGKPRIAGMALQSGLRVDPVLLDRAFTFAPGGVLQLSNLLTTRERLAGLGIFPDFNLRLSARPDGQFDAGFTTLEKDGWGQSTPQALVSLFRGIGYQTLYPEYFNAAHSAVNVTSLVRWDKQKRRVEMDLSAPFHGDPKYSYRVGLDTRDEAWDLQSAFTGAATSLGALHLRKAAVSGEVTSFAGAGWGWSMGGELSYRGFRDVLPGAGLTQQFLMKGYQLKQTSGLDRKLLRLPEHRFESSAHFSAETGRIWSAQAQTFEKLQAAIKARWLPRMTGDDYAMEAAFRAGRVLGSVPFDELYMLGLERDNDLWMRAHIGTRDGRKGSAPLGTNYVLSNWEIDKNVYSNGLLSVKLSPFFDTGKSADSITGSGSRKLLCDTGVQAKLHFLGVGFVLVYGKDLRTGNNAYYLMAGR